MTPSRGSLPRHVPRGHVMLAALLALTCALALLAAPAEVRAHANIDRAEPAPDSTLPSAPAAVRIWFTEPVAANASAIEVLDVSGRRVDAGDSRVDLGNPSLMVVSLGVLPTGTYTVAWRNTSTVDGHPLRGTYAFSVGVAPPAGPGAAAAATSEVSPLDPLARWAVFGGLFVALGVQWFALAILAPVLAARDVRVGTVTVDRRITGGALAVLAAGMLVHLLLQPQGDGGLAGVVAGTRWGQMWALRAALAGVAALLWWRAPRGPRTDLVVLALLSGAAVTLSFASHAAATRGLVVTAVANDVVHTLTSALWVGGLVGLLAVVRASRGLAPERRGALVRAVARRFSPFALIITAALLITGTYATWLQVAAWAALDTTYGWAVIAKVALFAGLVLLAALNLLWVTRRLADARVPRTLALSVGGEVVLVLAALLAAGVLTSNEPAREAYGSGARVATATSGTMSARIAVSPGNIGTNRIEVRVEDRGRPLAEGPTTSVTLLVKFAGADLGSREVALTRDASGAFVAERVVLSLVGPWQFEVGVSAPGSFDAQAAARIEVAPAGVQGIALPAESSALLAAGWQVVVLALVVLVVSEASWKGTRTARTANWTGTALVVAGIMMVYGVGHFHAGPEQAVGGRANPILPTDESVAMGREIYQARCVSCHGTGGEGDGPQAASLNPPPARLTLHVPLHGDGDIYAFIAEGLPGTAMPAWRDTLTEDQIWHLVNYLRTLKPPAQ
ncbi:MAG: copper resistance protein CopC [Dehalococcoidia bacterium]